MALYTATVASVTRGWSYTATQGDPASASPDVQLADGLVFRWGFEKAQVPGPLVPATATVQLVAKDASKLPAVERGDYLTIDLRVGTTGARIVKPAPMRVTEVQAELNIRHTYSAAVTVQLVEQRAELDNVNALCGGKPYNAAASNGASGRFRPRLAEVAIQAQWSIGCPSWWADAEDISQPANMAGNFYFGMPPGFPNGAIPSGIVSGGVPLVFYPWSVSETIDRILASHQPQLVHHSAYSVEQAGYPTGYVAVRPTLNWGETTSNPTDTTGAVADPATNRKVLLVPADRRADGSTAAMPLIFTVTSGELTLATQYVAGSAPQGHARIGLDAAWCDIPATVRKSRDHAINTLIVKGDESFMKDATDTPQTWRVGQRQYQNPPAVAADGGVQREIETMLYLGDAADSYQATKIVPTETSRLQSVYLTDDSARTAWVYDAFTVKASRVPAARRDAVLSRIAPRGPGETNGDGHVLRHAVIYRPADEVRAGGELIAGFIATGQLEVRGGDITFTLTLTPGQTQWTGGTPSPVTVGQVDAASYQAQQLSTIDPLIRVTDLAYVAA